MDFLYKSYEFLILNNFSGFTTILAGTIAWIVYYSQKKDKKTNAARIILSEILLAEERIEVVKDLLRRDLNQYPSVLPINSWKQYSHLFASDFDQSQLKEINNFYNTCEIIEDAIKRDDSYFWITTEHIAKTGQSMATRLIYKSLDKNSKFSQKKFDNYFKEVVGQIGKSNNIYVYSPSRTKDTIKFSVSNINTISASPLGLKLKKMGNISQNRLFIFRLFVR